MPGIGGFAGASGTESATLLSKMVQSMCHFSWHVLEERLRRTNLKSSRKFCLLTLSVGTRNLRNCLIESIRFSAVPTEKRTPSSQKYRRVYKKRNSQKMKSRSWSLSFCSKKVQHPVGRSATKLKFLLASCFRS